MVTSIRIMCGGLEECLMRILGISLLLAGWLIVLASVALLGRAPAVRLGFLTSGILIEVVGFVYLTRAHLPARGARKW